MARVLRRSLGGGLFLMSEGVTQVADVSGAGSSHASPLYLFSLQVHAVSISLSLSFSLALSLSLSLSLSLYINIHTCLYIHIYIYIHIYRIEKIRVSISVYIHICVYTHKYPRMAHPPTSEWVVRGARPRIYRGTSLIRNTHLPRITIGP